jgi:hypothetical protein
METRDRPAVKGQALANPRLGYRATLPEAGWVPVLAEGAEAVEQVRLTRKAERAHIALAVGAVDPPAGLADVEREAARMGGGAFCHFLGTVSGRSILIESYAVTAVGSRRVLEFDYRFPGAAANRGKGFVYPAGARWYWFFVDCPASVLAKNYGEARDFFSTFQFAD